MLPDLVCNHCGATVNMTINGLCAICYAEGQPVLCPGCGSKAVMGNRKLGTCLDCSLLWESESEFDQLIVINATEERE